MDVHLLFAKISWLLLIIILFVRPLNDIFHWKISQRVMCYRKQLGIACGIFAILHAAVYLISINALGIYFSNSAFWKLDNLFGWGSFALVAMLFPLLTSNVFSQKFFKKNWKTIQRITYPAFVLAAIHVAFVKGEWLASSLLVSAWVILWFLAERKKACR